MRQHDELRWTRSSCKATMRARTGTLQSAVILSKPTPSTRRRRVTSTTETSMHGATFIKVYAVDEDKVKRDEDWNAQVLKMLKMD